MSSLAQLIRNENMKIYRRPRTWLMILFLLAAVGLLAGLNKYNEHENRYADWRASLQQQNEAMQRNLQTAEGQADAEAIRSQIARNDYYLAQGIDPNDWRQMDQVKDSASLMMFATLLVVVVAADLLAAEFSAGTIKLLLVGPASRAKILLAKYASLLGFAAMLTVICFAASYIAGGIFEGFGSLGQQTIGIGASGAIEKHSLLAGALENYGYQAIGMLIYATFAFMISSAFRSSSMAIAFSLFFMLMGNALAGLLSKYEWVKYLLFSNIDLSQYAEGSSPLRPEMTLAFSIGMLAAYYVLFHLVAWLLFTKRDVAA